MTSSENGYGIDPRSRADVIKELEALAKSYTPEWKFDPVTADVGSAIALLFAHLLSGSIQKANTLHEKAHDELVDLLELAPHPATPSESVVRFSLADTVDGGRMIPRKTKLFAQGEDGEPIHFETARALYATTAAADRLFLSDAEVGRLAQVHLADDGLAGLSIGNGECGTFLPTTLTLAHPYAFCLEEGSTLRIHFDGTNGINEQLAQKDLFEWCFWSARGFVPFDRVEWNKAADSVCLRAGCASAPWQEQEYFAVRVTSRTPIRSRIAVKGIYLDTDSTEVSPEEVWCGDLKVPTDRFLPFGEILSVFNECYVACDAVLTQRGAKVVMKMDLALDQKRILEPQESPQLKVIMRKRSDRTILPTDVYAQEVSFEYFNGIGWNRLPLSNAANSLFSGTCFGTTTLEFICPKDIEAIELNAFFKHWIRVRVIRSEGCYAQNAVHHYPIVSGLSFSHSYDARACQPEELYRLFENRLSLLGDRLRFSEECPLFEPMSFDGRSLLLGFRQPLHGGPLSLYFEIENHSMVSDFRLAAQYSAASGENGFRPLQIVDFTDGLAHSGAVVFAGSPDMRSRLAFGEERFWIRFRLEALGRKNCNPTIILRKIYLNGVEVSNRFTHPTENFYLSPLDSSTVLQLSATDLLSAEVFVNEAVGLSTDEQKRLLAERPSDVRCVYDSLGGVRDFFVRWSEVTGFGGSKPNDRHYVLDRVHSRLIFSDGAQAMAPPKQSDVAVSVVAVSTAGSKGNVAAHTIQQAYELLEYVDRIDNSEPACNGSDMETREQLMHRASCLLRSGNRIVTRADLCAAVLGMSSLVTKVKLIDERDGFTLLVLPRDFEHGAQVFNGMKERIRNKIFSEWEAVAERTRFAVEQPDYLAVSVSGWLVMDSGDADMDLLGAVEHALHAFLNPVSGGFSGNGWEIGNIPSRSQILSVIRSVCPNGRVENLCVTGTIEGADGMNEYDLQMNHVLPKAVCVSGQHHIMAKLEMRGD